MAINFLNNPKVGDNTKIEIGTGSDLQIYHDGSNSFITNSTGDFTISNTGDDLILKSADDFLLYVQGSELAIQAVGNAGVVLRYNNVAKFETTSTGVTVPGTVNTGGGNAATPAIIFEGNTDTGLFHPATDEIGFSTAGSERMRITSAGNLAIGTTSATSKLTISDNSYQVMLVDTSTSNRGEISVEDAAFGFYADRAASTADSSFFWSIDNLNKMEINLTAGGEGQLRLNDYGPGNITGTAEFILGVDANGNVIETSAGGSGTVTGTGAATRVAFWSGTTALSSDANLYWDNTNDRLGIGTTAPSKQLEILYPSYINKDTVQGLIRLIGQSNTENSGDVPSAGVGIEFYNKWTGGLPYSTGRISARSSQSYDGGLQFDVSQNTAPGQTNFITAMSILDTGNVGIGTSSPNETLSLYKSDRPYIQFTSNTTGTTSSDGSFIGFANADGFLEIRNKEAQPIRLSTSDTERMRIDSAGNVGIGTTSIASGDGKLKISSPSGNSSVAGISLYGNNGGAFGGSNVVRSKIESKTDGTAFGANMLFYTNDTSNVYQERMRIDSAGDVLIGQTSFGTGLSGFAQLEVSNATAGGIVINTQTASTSNYSRLMFTKGNAAGNEGVIRYNTGDYHMSFWTNAQEKMRITSAGNVGIGVTAPASKLNINGTANGLTTAMQVWQSGETALAGDIGGRAATFFGASGSTNSSIVNIYSTNAYTTQYGGEIGFGGKFGSTGSVAQFAKITSFKSNGSNGSPNYGGGLKFWTRPNGASAVERITILGDGNVGIGTTAPDRKLVLDGTLGTAALEIKKESDRLVYLGTGSSAAGDDNTLMILYHDDVAKVQINTTGDSYLNGGNVGIGTTSPLFKLTVEHSDEDGLMFKTTNTSNTFINFADPEDNDAGQINYDHETNYMGFRTNGASRMRIDSAGNVLINATSKFNAYPASFVTQTIASSSGDNCPILELVGNRSAAFGNQNGMIQFFNKTSTAVEVGRISSIQGSASNSGQLKFMTANAGTIAERMRITSAGNVGIGTTSPSALLEVAGSALLQKSFYQTMPNNAGTANKGGYIARPKGGDFITQSSSQTGSLEIQLPTGGNTMDDMVKFVIDIYEYSTNRSLTVFVGGYIYQGIGGTTWTNCSAQVIGSTAADNYTVRFGDNDNVHCVWIGETTETWSYPQVIVRDFYGGFITNVTEYLGDWDIDFVSEQTNVAITLTNNFPLSSGGASGAFLPLSGGTLTGALTGTSATFAGNISAGATTDTVDRSIKVLSGDTKQASLEAYGAAQGTGVVYVGQSASYGGGIVYNGDGSPAFGNVSTDTISFYRREAGTNYQVFKYGYGSSTVTFAGNINFGDSHFIGDDSDDNLLIQSSTNENVIINSADDLYLRTSGTTQLTISSTTSTFSGNVDLGNNNITDINVLSFDDGISLFGGGDDSYLHYKSSDVGAGGIEFFDGNDARQGYLYYDGDNNTPSFGLLDASGTWAVRILKDGLVELRHDNSVKFVTTSTGVSVTGKIVADGLNYNGTSGGELRIDNSSGGGIGYYADQSGHTFNTWVGSWVPQLVIADSGTATFAGNVIVSDSIGIGTTSPDTKLDVVGGILRNSTRISGALDNRKYPLGHYNSSSNIFDIDPTWSQDELRAFFNNTGVAWVADADAPGGYAIEITGGVYVGGAYTSGFPYIPIDTSGSYYMECYVKNVTAGNGHYMGGIDFNESFGSLGGNPGSYGYWVMSNTNPGTSWTKVSGTISGFGNSTGQFKAGTKYMTPMSLFNYNGAVAVANRVTRISGWRMIRTDSPGSGFLPLAGGTMTLSASPLILPGEESNAFKIAFTGASASSGLSTVDQLGAGLYIGANSRVNSGGVVVTNNTLLPGSGIYFDGWSNDDMRFFTGATGNPSVKMIIESGGNVGIGTTTPGEKLEVYGPNLGTAINNTATQARFRSDNANNSQIYIQDYRTSAGTDWTTSGKRLQMKVDSTWMGYMQFNGTGNQQGISWGTGATTTQSNVPERMRITSAGNVGIGTTAPASKLVVSDVGQVNGNQNITARIVNVVAGATSSAVYIGASSGTDWLIGKNIYGVSTQTYFQIGNQSGTTPAMTIATNNNIGIGTISPSMALHVSRGGSTLSGIGIGQTGTGSSRVYMDASNGDFSGGDYMQMGQNNDLSGDIQMEPGAGAFNIKTGTGSPTRFTVLQNGKVGIGTTSPDTVLELEGAAPLLKLSSDTAAGSPYLQFAQTGTRRSFIQHNDSGDNLLLASEYGGIQFFTGTGGTETQKMVIQANGTVGIGTTNPVNPLQVTGKIYSSTDIQAASQVQAATYRWSATTTPLEQSGALTSSEPANPPDFTPDGYIEIKVQTTVYLIPIFEKQT